MTTDSRDRMIRTTARLLRQQGYHGTGLNQIAAAAEAPKGSMYFHFPGGKAQLAAEAVGLFADNVAKMLGDAIAQTDSAAAAVAGYLQQIADGVDAEGTFKGCAVGVVAMEVSPFESALAEATHRALTMWTDLLAAQLVKEGHDERRAQVLATTAIAAIEGAIVLARGTSSSAPVRDVREAMLGLLAPA